MRKHRAAIALSMAALTVAVLGQTSIGHAAAGAVRVALFAQNSGRVNNIQASRRPVPGRLLPLNAKGQFPSSVLPARDAGGSFTHTIIVNPHPDHLQAGRSLVEAVAGIADASASNPYLVKIEPGIYDLGDGSLVMRPHIDIEGSGEDVTTVTSAIGTGLGTVVGASNAELRFVTVRNTGETGQQVVALFSESTSPRYTHVTATSSGGSENTGIHVSNGTPVLSNVTASASGGGKSIGVTNLNGVLTVSNSSFSAADAAGLNAGLFSTMGGTVRATSSTMTASGGAIAIGLRTYNGSHTVANMTLSGSGGAESYGVYNGWRFAAPIVNVHQSRVSGGTNSIYSVGGTIKVGASQLTGPAGADNQGTVLCAVTYDATFSPLGPGCAVAGSSRASGPASSRRGR
jgi:hypothetical protein